MFAPSTQALLNTRKGTDVDSELHRRRIDQRLAELQAEMQALKNCRNSLSNIINLPPEILSEIFLLVQLDYQSQNRAIQRRWMWITHVCSHWRKVAFEHVALWTTPTFSNPALTEFQLSRAGQAPLTIKFTATRNKSIIKVYNILCEIFSQPDRLRSVSIAKSRKQYLYLQRVLEGCSGRAPHLEYLSIHDGALHPDFEIPSHFLAGGAPVLKSLDIYGCRITTWDALPVGPSLTSFKLPPHRVLDPNLKRPSWENLVQSLKQMPFLQNLHLGDVLPLSDWSPTLSESKQECLSRFTLQELDTLDIHYSSPAAITQIIELLSFPNVSYIGFTFSQVGSLGFLQSFFATLRTSQCREFDPVHELRLQGPIGDECVIRFKSFPPSGRSTGLELVFQGPAGTPGDLALVAKKVFDLSSLSVLEVSEGERFSAEVWTSVFSPVKALESISIIGNTSVKMFADALMTANHSMGFGALASLKLKGINFREEDINIHHALQNRPEAAPRITLFIEDAYNFGEGQLEEITDGAPKVQIIWDGYEDYDLTGEDSSSESSGGSEDI